MTVPDTGDILDVVPLHHHRHLPVALVDIGGEVENSGVRANYAAFVNLTRGPGLAGTLLTVIVADIIFSFML